MIEEPLTIQVGPEHAAYIYVGVDLAAGLAGVSTAAIRQAVARRAIHSVRANGGAGRVLIPVNSLRDYIDARPRGLGRGSDVDD